jgi:hypothetical protein
MTIDGIKHPRQMFKWTTSELKAVGIVPVTTSGTSLNSNYYIETNEAFAVAGDKNSVVRTIGVKSADKALTDTNDVDEDGEAILDDHDNQTVTLGLKSVAKNKADVSADGYIKGFDWLVQRKVTHDTDIPSDILTYISSVRTAHASICTAIAACDTMTKYIAIHTTTYNEDGTVNVIAKVQDWPDDYAVKVHRR